MKQEYKRSRIKKNDSVVVTTGADRGRRGKVIKIGVKTGRIIVEGINKKNKHLKPGPETTKRRDGEC